MKWYCEGCFWKYNNECIKSRGDYCPASSIKARERREMAKLKEKEK